MILKRFSFIYLLICVVDAQSFEPKVCGKRKGVTGTSFGGTQVKKGEWPWLVAFTQRYEKEFFCGGNLIGRKHVLSAAHCFQNKGRQRKTSPQYVLALIGKYDLNVDDEFGTKVSLVWDIVLHPDWNFNEEKFDADIALAVLTDRVEFSNHIQPVCLPQPSHDEVAGEGSVVGWGKSKTDHFHDVIPNELVVPAVNSSHCYTTFHILGAISSNRAFCGGFDNQGKAPCLGDSGSGFYLKDTSTSSWNVRGIVSASIIDFDYGCDINKYSLYTNVARFVPWILNVQKETEVIVRSYIEFECEDGEFNGISAGYNYTTHCSFPNKEIKTRGSMLNPNFAKHKTIKSPNDLKNFWSQFHGSSFIFSGIGETFPNLKQLGIVYGNLSFIERADFANMEKLTDLDFTENPIRLIAEDVFWDLHGLERLNMQVCEIEYLPKKLFKNLRNLKELSLWVNKLKKLDRELFTNLQKLKKLDISNNHMIKPIEPDVFWDLIGMEELRLESWAVYLKKMPFGIFKNMRKLKILILSGNTLTQIDKSLFENNLELEEIDLGANQLKVIDVDFTKLTKLKALNLKNNDCINDEYSSEESDSSMQSFQRKINLSCESTALEANKWIWER